MSKLAQYWPTIRQVVYGVLAAGLAVAAAAGWITSEQSDQWLAHAVTALGALGFIVAGLYVPKAPASAPKPDPNGGAGGDGGWPTTNGEWTVTVGSGGVGGTPPLPSIPDVVAQAQRTVQDVATQAQSTVDQARAELERRLGR